MAKKRRRSGRAAARPPSDGESSDAESVSGVWQLDEDQLRGRLAAQPKKQWCGRDEEIHACEESIRKKEDLKASAAISANGCCQCFTVHMCLAVFTLLTAGLLLTAVGAAGTAPRLTPANVFQKYQGVEECVMLLNGNLIPVSKWSGDPDELCPFSREKMEARMEETKELEAEPEPESSGKEEAGAFECQECGRCFDTEKGLGNHQARWCTGPIEEDDDESEEATETDAARAFLGGLDFLTGPQLVDAGDVGGFHGLGVPKSRAIDRLLERVHSEVAGLKPAALASKLREVEAAVAARTTPAQRRATYVLARVEQLLKPVLLARANFYDESGVFQRPLCEAYVRGIQGIKGRDRKQRLRAMIKELGGTTPSRSSDETNDAFEAALVDAYETKTPEDMEASKYNPLAAPKIEEVIAKHGEKLRGRANDDAVLKAVAQTASGFLRQTKGGFMATTGSVVYVHTLWLLRLVLDGRTVGDGYDKIFEAFEADDEGKREGYFEADAWLSAVKLEEAKRVHYNHLEKYDEARHTRGEIVYGGNGTDGYSIVCFIVEGRKVFVLFNGREDYVLVNEVTMECLAFVAATVVPIVLAETSTRLGDENYGALSSDALPRIKDLLASEQDEQENRRGFRGKWKAMSRFFDGYFADVLSEIAAEGGTITSAPAALSKAAGGVPRQGPIGSSDGPKDGFSFDEGQVRNLILRLRGGGSGMCGGKGSSSGNGGESDNDDSAGPTGTGSSGGGGAKKKKRPRTGNMGGLMGTDWSPRQWRAGTNG